MFSLDKFYNIIHNNLLSAIPGSKSVYFYPFGTYDYACNLTNGVDTINQYQRGFFYLERSTVHCYFADQEPFYQSTIPVLEKSLLRPVTHQGPMRINILATSEQSEIVKQYTKSVNFYHWYYFYHGFAALDWYKNYQYVEPNSFNRFDKVFICYNHLISNLRSYRLHLVAGMAEKNLLKHGRVSLFPSDPHGTWQDTLTDIHSPLDQRAQQKIQNHISQLNLPLTIDTATPTGALSADVKFDDLVSALWHVVTETVYFDSKLHLTEKVFKPIIAKRPFLLAAAPGNLAYLRSYGFRTFDQWIDESYDHEPDHYIRIEKILTELERLCDMSPQALATMHTEMQSVLEHNYNHFYHNFKGLLIDELVDNFEHIFMQINNGRQLNNHSRYHKRFELDPAYLQQVKTRLKQ
jgi:hypothetical protein